MTQEDPMETSNPLVTQLSRIKLTCGNKQNPKYKPGEGTDYLGRTDDTDSGGKELREDRVIRTLDV